MNQDKLYEVNSIVAKRLVKNTIEYFLLRWQGYGPEDDTWQPEEDCIPVCYDLVVNLENSLFEQKKQRSFTREIIGWKRDFSGRIKLLVEWRNKTKKIREFYYSSVIRTHDECMLMDYYEKNISAFDLDPELAHFHDSLVKTENFDEYSIPHKIIAVAYSKGSRLYLISLKNEDEASIVDHNFLKSKYPELLLEFYEEHLLTKKDLINRDSNFYNGKA